MTTERLSPILDLPDNLHESIDIAYEYFKKYIQPKEARPQIYGKNIFVDCREWVEDRPCGFWHLVSISTKHDFPEVLPCTNDPSINVCDQNCNINRDQITIKHGLEVRNLCRYRASRLPWILDIIQMANKNDPAIKAWVVPGSYKKYPKLHLRFNEKGIDYIVIFSIEDHCYRLVSAFPVFYLTKKITYDRMYERYGSR